jgi:hypothetical protein
VASVRKRTWKTDGVVKTAWVADYFDQAGERRLKSEIEEAAVALAIEQLWQRHDLASMKRHLKAPEAKVVQDGMLLTEA